MLDDGLFDKYEQYAEQFETQTRNRQARRDRKGSAGKRQGKSWEEIKRRLETSK